MRYLILGGSGGIGAALSRKLVAQGHDVVIAGRNLQTLQAVADELHLPWLEVDATSFEAVERATREAKERLGGLDGIACCIGSILLKPAHLTSYEDFEAVMRTNLGSAFAVVRAAGLHLREHGGSVVLVSSVAARVGLPNHEAIAAAKAGVQGLVLSAAATYAPQGLRINAVAPALTRTPLSRRLVASPAAEKASADMHPLGRIGEVDDIAPMMAWLLGEESSWVTGQVFGLDGGMSTVRPRPASPSRAGA
jgi:3-oxoacyl-[acyl-carrier protein] reductase